MNIVLIGYRGSGKTSIGKLLASKLRRPFVDTDDLVTQAARKTIREIFEAEGEAGFRDREAAAIREAAARDNLILAIGGGAILRPENVALLKTTGKLIWLRAAPETLLAHIQSDAATSATRPNLTAAGGLAEVELLLAKRTPLYQSVADLTLEVTNLTLEEAATHLAAMI